MYEAFIFSEENGDAGIDFADSKGYEHFGLGGGIGAWIFVCVGVARALGKGALALYSIGIEGLGLGISSRYFPILPVPLTNKHLLSPPAFAGEAQTQRAALRTHEFPLIN